jgi:hypothetical protein
MNIKIINENRLKNESKAWESLSPRTETSAMLPLLKIKERVLCFKYVCVISPPIIGQPEERERSPFLKLKVASP